MLVGAYSLLLCSLRWLLLIYGASHGFDGLGNSCWSIRGFSHWLYGFGDYGLLNWLFYWWLSFARLSDGSLSRFSLLNSHLRIRIITLFLLALRLFNRGHFICFFCLHLWWFLDNRFGDHLFYLGFLNLYLWFLPNFTNNLGRRCWCNFSGLRHDLLVSSSKILI